MTSPAVKSKDSPRWIFKAIALVSLLLCLAAVALWIRSNWYWDTFLRARAGGTYVYIDSHQGNISFARKSDCPLDQHAFWSSTNDLRANYSLNVPKTIVQPDGTEWTRFFIYQTSGEFRPWSSGEPSVYFPSQLDLELNVPYWPLPPILAIAPGISAFYMLRQRRRFKLGLCPNCGAEVHANVERCPECGIPRQLKDQVA